MSKLAPTQETADVAALRKSIQEKSGGTHFYVRLLGIKSVEVLALMRKVEAGFPYSTFERFQQNSDLQVEELAELVGIPRRTLARRREMGRLTADESDRLLRASRWRTSVAMMFNVAEVPFARTHSAT